MTVARIVHFADLHLGIELHGSPDPKTGLSTRVLDFLRVFDSVIDFAVSERVDAVLFAGDAFKNRDPNPTLQRAFAQRIRRLTEAQIPTVLLVGNHDLPIAVVRATPMDIYQALGLPGIRVARDIETIQIPLRSGAILQVVTLPWLPINRMLTSDAYRALQREELDREFRSVVSAVVHDALAQLDPEHPAVLLGHVSIEGARLGGERSIMLGDDPVFSTAELGLHDAPLDYVALGHIHRHQVVTERPPVVYAGSLERIDFGEEDDQKGFIVVEIDAGRYPERGVRWQFHPVDARVFRTLRLRVPADEPEERLQRAIERRAQEIQEAVVRVVLEVESDQTTVPRLSDVRRWLYELGVAHVAGIQRVVERSDRPRVEVSADEATDPERMLERWLDLRQLPDELRREVLVRGRELIRRSSRTELV